MLLRIGSWKMPLVNENTESARFIEGNGSGKSYFGTLATIILLIVLVILIYPAIQHITKLNREISDAKVVERSLQTKLENIDKAKVAYKAIEKDIPTIELAFPIGSDFVPYLKKLESMADQSKLRIVAAQVTDTPLSKPKTNDGLKTKTLDYTLTFEGSFVDFKGFLKNLENLIRTSDVSIINVGRDPDNILNETITASSYYLSVVLTPSENNSELKTPSATEGLPNE